MPTKVSEGKYKCNYCKEIYYNELMATSCELGHDIIYVPIYREDLQRLMQFLVTGNEKLITERLGKTLRKYSSGR